MVSRETAVALAYAYAEIESAEKLLAHLVETKKDRTEPDFRDVFGRRRGLQLGVPSGDNGHRLLDVPFPLAEIVIKAHLDAKRAELAALSEKARLEIEACLPRRGEAS